MIIDCVKSDKSIDWVEVIDCVKSDDKSINCVKFNK